ncbi:type 1 glutamine amidotransferase [Thiomicrorhabdus sp.]|uniref:type 1 glutamine amidotransferase n=1 Tax=Thiomicrorhabdus sp. TaxID=2039724 RepID=UPI0029C7633C|nr:type 1 glutamine amidotransferase [Thiomicrorhabdus sp.]
MNVAVLVHAPFERLGQIEQWLIARRAVIHFVNLYEEGAAYPELDSLDMVIVLGGPMSVNEEEIYPWLVAEKAFIRRVIAADLPLLGICLGGQLIATALGAEVTGNPEVEIGWHTIERVSGEDESVFRFPQSMTIFNWHGETFELPPGAKRLIQSRVCKNQGFQIGDRIIGLQCHPEVTGKEIREWIDEVGEQMVSGDYVHSPQAMLSHAEQNAARVQPVLFALLEYLCDSAKLSDADESY